MANLRASSSHLLTILRDPSLFQGTVHTFGIVWCQSSWPVSFLQLWQWEFLRECPYSLDNFRLVRVCYRRLLVDLLRFCCCELNNMSSQSFVFIGQNLGLKSEIVDFTSHRLHLTEHLLEEFVNILNVDWCESLSTWNLNVVWLEFWRIGDLFAVVCCDGIVGIVYVKIWFLLDGNSVAVALKLSWRIFQYFKKLMCNSLILPQHIRSIQSLDFSFFVCCSLHACLPFSSINSLDSCCKSKEFSFGLSANLWNTEKIKTNKTKPIQFVCFDLNFIITLFSWNKIEFSK